MELPILLPAFPLRTPAARNGFGNPNIDGTTAIMADGQPRVVYITRCTPVQLAAHRFPITAKTIDVAFRMFSSQKSSPTAGGPPRKTGLSSGESRRITLKANNPRRTIKGFDAMPLEDRTVHLHHRGLISWRIAFLFSAKLNAAKERQKASTTNGSPPF